MMAFGKRHLVLAALVVALGAAVYLNWQFSDNQDLISTNASESGGNLGDAQYVGQSNVLSSAEEGTSTPSSSQASSGDASSSTVATSTSEYFAQARINREQSRDEATEMLEEVLKDATVSETEKANALSQVTQIAKDMQSETNIENLVKAKGYAECLAFIQNGACNIVVAVPDQLLESDVVIIKDIVTGQTDITVDNIKIVQAK